MKSPVVRGISVNALVCAALIRSFARAWGQSNPCQITFRSPQASSESIDLEIANHVGRFFLTWTTQAVLRVFLSSMKISTQCAW